MYFLTFSSGENVTFATLKIACFCFVQCMPQDYAWRNFILRFLDIVFRFVPTDYFQYVLPQFIKISKSLLDIFDLSAARRINMYIGIFCVRQHDRYIANKPRNQALVHPECGQWASRV